MSWDKVADPYGSGGSLRSRCEGLVQDGFEDFWL